jgi:hypothetical protein
MGKAHPKRECSFCKFPISAFALAGHEKRCELRSPEQREVMRVQRELAAQKEDRRHTLALTKSSAALGANSTGTGRRRVARRPRASQVHVERDGARRLSITLSLDFKVLRALLFKLAPSLSVDKVSVL